MEILKNSLEIQACFDEEELLNDREKLRIFKELGRVAIDIDNENYEEQDEMENILKEMSLTDLF